MLKLNSFTFYKRHQNELNKYIFSSSKTLHIISDDIEKSTLSKNCEYLFVNKEEDFNSVIKSIRGFYDLIIITDLLESAEDINELFFQLHLKLEDTGKLLITSLNNIWYPVINFFEKLKLKKVSRKKVYTSEKKIKNILSENNFRFISYNTRQYIPFKIFKFGDVLNGFVEIIFSKFNLGMKTYILYQKKSINYHNQSKTIIIPAKNEEKNLLPLIERIPNFKNLEVVIVYGKSEDKTAEIAEYIRDTSKFNVSTFQQSGKGKANAVFEALKTTKNDLIAILDADLSVDPETLSDFFGIIERREADFVNGTRFVYRMEKESMRFFNIIGNKTFQYLISIVISRNLSDSLCGTKVFNKNLKEKILDWQEYNSVRDPFGDFDLIFSAAFSGQSIIEFPIHYKSRVYGVTQISRFRDGFKLLKYFIMSLIKFNTSIN
jgi:hypothetical protein